MHVVRQSHSLHYIRVWLLYSSCISPIQSSEQRNVTRLPSIFYFYILVVYPKLRAAQCDQTSFATVARGISPASGSRRCVRQNVAKCATNMSKCNKQHKYLAKYIPFNKFLLVLFSLLYNKQPLKQIGNISPTACKPKSTREQFQCQRQIIFTSSAACPVSNANLCWSVTLLN